MKRIAMLLSLLVAGTLCAEEPTFTSPGARKALADYEYAVKQAEAVYRQNLAKALRAAELAGDTEESYRISQAVAQLTAPPPVEVAEAPKPVTVTQREQKSRIQSLQTSERFKSLLI